VRETILIVAKAIFVLIFAVVIPLLIASSRPLQLLLVPAMAFWILWDCLSPPKKRR